MLIIFYNIDDNQRKINLKSQYLILRRLRLSVNLKIWFTIKTMKRGGLSAENLKSASL
jgi:hypothetical protein